MRVHQVVEFEHGTNNKCLAEQTTLINSTYPRTTKCLTIKFRINQYLLRAYYTWSRSRHTADTIMVIKRDPSGHALFNIIMCKNNTLNDASNKSNYSERTLEIGQRQILGFIFLFKFIRGTLNLYNLMIRKEKNMRDHSYSYAMLTFFPRYYDQLSADHRL